MAIVGIYLPFSDLPNILSRATFTFGLRFVIYAPSSAFNPLPTRTTATLSLYGLLIIAFFCDLISDLAESVIYAVILACADEIAPVADATALFALSKTDVVAPRTVPTADDAALFG